MITQSLFRKNFIIFASIALVFVAVALLTSWILTSFERDRMSMGPATMDRILLESLDEEPKKALQKLNEICLKLGMKPRDLINPLGVSTLSGRQILAKPLSSEDLKNLKISGTIALEKKDFLSPPGLTITKTSQADVFLLSQQGPPPGEGRPPIGPLVTLVALIACILVSIAVALLYQFSKYRERSEEALHVLSALREGQLSARLSTKKFDELAPLTLAFNQMANDLEIMVDQLRKADHSRRQLLQDLAHDLRTPLTSLRTFLETLYLANDRLTEEKRREVLLLCTSEVEYFGKLVEDLLFLAQITEPKYSLGAEKIDLKEKIQEHLLVFRERYPEKDFSLSTSPGHHELIGSSQLLGRLLRNALENSTSFAQKKVVLHLKSDNDKIEVLISDDGPGFSEKALQDFGHKKASRVLQESQQGQRISVGIGSVIMKEIAVLHMGTVTAENIYNGSEVQGAKVSISLKKS